MYKRMGIYDNVSLGEEKGLSSGVVAGAAAAVVLVIILIIAGDNMSVQKEERCNQVHSRD